MVSNENKKLEELRNKVKEAKKVRDGLNAKLKSKRDSVMGLYNEIDKLLKEARKQKEIRDAANKRVSEYKKNRDKANSRMAELGKKLGELKNQSRGLPSRREYERLKSDYEKLNWKIQTSPLPKDKETAMVKRLEELEIRLREYELLNPVGEEISKLEKELKETRKKADSYHKKLLESSDEGEKAHIEMHEIYKRVDNKRKKAKKAEEEFLAIKKKVEDAHKRFVEILNELRAEEKRLGIKRIQERKVRSKNLKKEQAAKEIDLLSELRKGGVIKTDDLLFLQEVEKEQEEGK